MLLQGGWALHILGQVLSSYLQVRWVRAFHLEYISPLQDSSHRSKSCCANPRPLGSTSFYPLQPYWCLLIVLFFIKLTKFYWLIKLPSGPELCFLSFSKFEELASFIDAVFLLLILNLLLGFWLYAHHHMGMTSSSTYIWVTSIASYWLMKQNYLIYYFHGDYEFIFSFYCNSLVNDLAWVLALT